MWWIAAALSEPVPVATTSQLEWMIGCWTAEIDGVKQQECWTPSVDGVMLGTHVDGGEQAFFEFLRIQRSDGQLTYFAQPGGKPAIAFVLKGMGERIGTFVNPKHDFPKAISYSREGDVLTATVEAGEHSRTWKWTLESP